MFAFRKVDQPPFIVNSALYWVFGLDPETFPDTYFDDPAVMTRFQERTYYDQVKEIDDDFVPYLMPWFGTAVVASAFGSQIEFPPKQDPAVNPRYYPVQTPEDIRKLPIPDPESDGLMPKVLEFLALHEAEQLLTGRDYRLPRAAHHCQSAHGLRQTNLPHARCARVRRTN